MNYGNFGGQHVPDKMLPVLEEVEKNFKEYCTTEEFKKLYKHYLQDYARKAKQIILC